ncbi:MAG: glycosyltransferase family 39 protein [Anaerolineae bacterium]
MTTPPERPARSALGRWVPAVAILITAAGFALRIWEIGRKTLWLDEAFSVWLAQHPLGEMLAWIARIDQHPPLYYVLLHFWIRLVGDGPAAVRLLSALLSTLTIPAVFLLGRRLLGPRGGLLAALILALSPFHVRFAQETRMYALLTLNATLALLALTYLLGSDRPPSPLRGGAGGEVGRQAGAGGEVGRQAGTGGEVGRQAGTGGEVGQQAGAEGKVGERRKLAAAWIGYVVFTAATMLTHHTALLFPLAVNLYVLGIILWRRLQKTPGPNPQYPIPHPSHWLLAQLAVLLLWSPWAAAFVAQAAGVDREFWIARPTFDTVIWTLKNFLSAMLPISGGRSDLIWAGYAALAVLGIVELRKRGALLALFVVLFVTPIAGEWLVSLRRPIFYDRTLIWATIPLYLLLAAGIARRRRWPLVVAAVGLIAAANVASLHEYYVHFQKEEWDKAAAHVAARAADDDLLLFNATWVQIPFDYYFRAHGRRVVEHGVPVDLFDRGVLEPKMTENDLPRLRALLAGRPRVWLIYSHNWYTDPRGLIPAALAQEFSLRDVRRFVGLEVQLYERPAE